MDTPWEVHSAQVHSAQVHRCTGAQSVYMQFTFSLHSVYSTQCTGSAHAVHRQCTGSVQAVYRQCNGCCIFSSTIAVGQTWRCSGTRWSCWSPQLRECHRDTGQVELFKFFQKHSIMPLEFFMLLPEIGKLQLEIGTLPLDKSRRELASSG